MNTSVSNRRLESVARLKYRPEDELRDALEPLVDMGCDPLQLKAFAIVLLAITPEVEREQIDQLRQRLAATETRLNRISKAVDDLAIINADPLLGLNGLRSAFGLDTLNGLYPPFSSDQEKGLELIRVLDQQPDLLRGYVGLVRQQIAHIKKAMHYRGSGPHHNRIKFALLQYVKECTGSPQYSLVSAFLEAFRLAHGGADIEADIEKESTPEALQQFFSRQRAAHRRSRPKKRPRE